MKAQAGLCTVGLAALGPHTLTLWLMREFGLLSHIYKQSAGSPAHVLIGPGDDMGMVELREIKLLAAVDQIIDGRHFVLLNTPIELVGRKAITRSLSDIAAMGGVPVASLAAAVLPPDFGNERGNALFDAMRETALRFECPLMGGDIAFHADASHPLICSVTVLAEPTNGRAIERRGAQVGDNICVTGALGGSLESNGLGRHLTFEPRIAVAQKLARQMGERLHAMIDVSDGLGRDASHIARMSGVQIQLEANRIPCNRGCDWKGALGDGEDYELCFACEGPPPAQIDDVPIHVIGRALAWKKDAPLVLAKVGDQVIDAANFGWEHASDRASTSAYDEDR